MQNETRGARFIRGLVKAVFIGCYAAFMWASIHHVATFFDNFEQNGTSDTIGSYLLAGAIDVTALVTTIGVMFFRKSMPKKIQVILWIFIVGLAIYSFFINWEYASHYQNTSLILQPTGQTTPVYDTHGVLHYIPVMVENTWLLYVNPALASCFTIFALIYSVVGEFFGTKAPTATELQARLSYLQETASVSEAIRDLEARNKKPGLIQRAKASALELKEAVKEVRKTEESDEESLPQTLEKPPIFLEEKRAQTLEKISEMIEENSEIASRKPERNTDKLTEISERNPQGIPEERSENASRNLELTEEETLLANTYEKTISWLSSSGPTVSLKVVSETMNQSMKLLRNRVESKKIRGTKNREIVWKDSVIAWAIREVIPKENQRIAPRKISGNLEEMLGETKGQSEVQRQEILEESGRQRDEQMTGKQTESR